MEFTLIHENKLKATLTAEDMRNLSLDYDDMDYNDPVTRTAIHSLLDRGRAETRFSPRGEKLFIEVFPCEGGGCVFYFTRLRTGGEGAPVIEPVLFEFARADDLIDGAVATHARYRQRIYRSSLYLYKGRYRLVVYPLDYSDRLSVYFLSEYGEPVGEGQTLAAYIEEHGREIIRDEAIETLARFFS